MSEHETSHEIDREEAIENVINEFTGIKYESTDYYTGIGKYSIDDFQSLIDLVVKNLTETKGDLEIAKVQGREIIRVYVDQKLKEIEAATKNVSEAKNALELLEGLKNK